MKKALDWLIAAIVLLLGRRRRRPPEVEPRIVQRIGAYLKTARTPNDLWPIK